MWDLKYSVTISNIGNCRGQVTDIKYFSQDNLHRLNSGDSLSHSSTRESYRWSPQPFASHLQPNNHQILNSFNPNLYQKNIHQFSLAYNTPPYNLWTTAYLPITRTPNFYSSMVTHHQVHKTFLCHFIWKKTKPKLCLYITKTKVALSKPVKHQMLTTQNRKKRRSHN